MINAETSRRELSHRLSCGVPTLRFVILMWCYHRRGDGREKARPHAGDPGRYGAPDAFRDGLPAWLRHRAPHRADQWKPGTAQPGYDLCLAGKTAAARLDRRRMGDLGQPA